MAFFAQFSPNEKLSINTFKDDNIFSLVIYFDILLLILNDNVRKKWILFDVGHSYAAYKFLKK